MKLSEAIREGAKKRPQAKYKPFKYNDEGELCSCALGAAYEGATGQTIAADIVMTRFVTARIADMLMPLEGTWVQLPVPIAGKTDAPLHMAIIGLNDEKDWTREKIADWLESIGY